MNVDKTNNGFSNFQNEVSPSPKAGFSTKAAGVAETSLNQGLRLFRVAQEVTERNPNSTQHQENLEKAFAECFGKNQKPFESKPASLVRFSELSGKFNCNPNMIQDLKN